VALQISETLKRGVGRRILTMFLVAAILPLIATAALAWYEVHRAQSVEVGRALHSNAKAYGVDIVMHLQDSAAKANEIVKIVQEYGTSALQGHDYLLADFETITQRTPAGDELLLFGSAAAAFDAAAIEERHIRSGSSQFLLVNTPNGFDPVLVLWSDATGREAIYLFGLDAGQLWTPRENTAFATELCVFRQTGATVYCTRPMSGDLHERLAVRPPGGWARPVSTEWQGEDFLAVQWQLFMGGNFSTEALDIVAIQPRSYALRTGADFRRVFAPALALVIILVGLLSLHSISQSLFPLHRLKFAAKQFAAGQLSMRVRVRTGDEFEWLADAFNNMAEKLGTQIDAMHAMSEIDRMILSGARFGEVSEKVIQHLTSMVGCDAAAVIGQASETSLWADMISAYHGEFHSEQIALPKELGHNWCQPRQVDLHQIADRNAPYKQRFLEYGQRYVVLVPVILQDRLMGILLLGSTAKFDMKQGELQRCVDLAGRFAVALASAEREEALFVQANFDELTSLPNRQLLKDRLEEMIDTARRENQSGALLFLDLDRFKEINDVHGHSVGDIVLVQAAQRIVAEVGENDLVARLGGDEFVVAIPVVHAADQPREAADKLLESLTEAFSVRGINHFVSASVGIALFPDDGDSVETLLKNADSAMYRAKDAGRARHEFFSEQFNEESRRKIDLERDLRMAFENRDLEVYYQPQFDIYSRTISGAEALLRWQHPEIGWVSPDEFIPLAEDSSLIVEIGRWLLEQTCRDLHEILNDGLHPGPTSVNVSARQLRDEEFTNDVLRALQKFLIHPGFLQIEITETTIAQNRDTAIGILEILRSKHVRVALDDFGTGYSSLGYLQQMPFDVIKIDKSFVETLGEGTPTDNICKTIISIASDLDKKSIAEGVETPEQEAFLRKNGCDFVQGYLYAEPMPFKQFVEFVRKQDCHTQRRRALEIVT
jgi:diguanylate cyclase (GGDEF)-like protein